MENVQIIGNKIINGSSSITFRKISTKLDNCIFKNNLALYGTHGIKIEGAIFKGFNQSHFVI